MDEGGKGKMTEGGKRSPGAYMTLIQLAATRKDKGQPCPPPP